MDLSSYGRIQSFDICLVITGWLDEVTRVTGSPAMVKAVGEVVGVGGSLGRDDEDVMGRDEVNGMGLLLGERLRIDLSFQLGFTISCLSFHSCLR